MCRILWAHGNFNQENLVQRVLDALEKSNGGHGNGYWVPGMEEPIKGEGVKNADVAKLFVQNKDKAQLWHTRIASAGSICDRNNHPFPGPDGSQFVHNGTWGGYWRFQQDEDTDTEVMARLVREHGMGALMSPYLSASGVFLLAKPDGTATLVKRSGSFYLNFLANGAGFMHASEALDYYMKCDAVIEVPNGVVLELDADGIPRRSTLTPVDIQPIHVGYSNSRSGSYGSVRGYTVDDDGYVRTRGGSSKRPVFSLAAEQAASESYSRKVSDWLLSQEFEENTSTAGSRELQDWVAALQSHDGNTCKKCPASVQCVDSCPFFGEVQRVWGPFFNSDSASA